jgi:glycosyltransferase involved in cell wall biosynthesis
MKIAYVISTFPPYRGGMGNVAFELAKSVALQQADVTIFTPQYGKFDTDYNTLFKVHKLKTFIRYGNSALIIQLLWRAWDYEIIHLHFPFIGAAIPCLLLKFIKGKKIKFFIHYHMDLVGRQIFKPIFFVYSKIFVPLLVRSADHIFITSRDYAKTSRVGKYYNSHKFKNKFSVLPNGVDINRFQPAAKSLTLLNRFNGVGKTIIVFVGGLDSAHYFKGLNYLLNSLKMMTDDNWRLLVVGDGNLRPVYEQMAISFGLESKVFFVGYANDEELVSYYQVADLCVLPSIDRSEAFGVVLIEAMACGKPVVASDLDGVREVVKNKVCGRLAKPKDVVSLKNALEYFIKNPRQRIIYGHAGRQQAVNEYGWRSLGERILKKYQEYYYSDYEDLLDK